MTHEKVFPWKKLKFLTGKFSLQFIMRKRQTRFNYGERCRPVSLDAYSLDSVSAYNSVRRKGAIRASKRSYGNPTFEDSVSLFLLTIVWYVKMSKNKLIFKKTKNFKKLKINHKTKYKMQFS